MFSERVTKEDSVTEVQSETRSVPLFPPHAIDFVQDNASTVDEESLNAQAAAILDLTAETTSLPTEDSVAEVQSEARAATLLPLQKIDSVQDNASTFDEESLNVQAVGSEVISAVKSKMAAACALSDSSSTVDALS
jgi:hypothetical protein